MNQLSFSAQHRLSCGDTATPANALQKMLWTAVSFRQCLHRLASSDIHINSLNRLSTTVSLSQSCASSVSLRWHPPHYGDTGAVPQYCYLSSRQDSWAQLICYALFLSLPKFSYFLSIDLARSLPLSPPSLSLSLSLPSSPHPLSLMLNIWFCSSLGGKLEADMNVNTIWECCRRCRHCCGRDVVGLDQGIGLG